MRNNIIVRIILIAYTLIISILTCGCWDYKEIEKRGYVLGIAIDEVDKENSKKNEFENMPLEAKGSLYSYTIQVPVISRSQNKPYGQSGGSADKERHWNLTIASSSFFEANREFATRLDYAPFYPHLQSIVISEAVAQDDLTKLFDMFLRDPEMRRRTKLFITPGSAKAVLEVVPKIDDYSSQYLRQLPNNNDKTSRMLHKTDLGKVAEAMHENRDFVLPKVIANKYEVKNAGCAVFKDNKMVGWLDEIKTQYAKWITNNVRGGLVSVNYAGYNNGPVVLEIKKVDSKQRPVVNGDALEMEISVKADLSIGEISMPGFQNTMDEDFLIQLEKLAEDEIKSGIEDTIAYVQEKYGTDIFLFCVNIRRFEPYAWEEIESNWDEHFKDLKVHVSVKVKINQIGLLK